MDKIIEFFRFNLRALSPARVFAFVGALGTLFIGLGYLLAAPATVSGTVLYVTLQEYAAVKPFGFIMAGSAIGVIIGVLTNKRSIVALWAFINVLIWIFIGVLFATEFPEAWFTILALWPINFFASLYTRYLATRPPGKDDDKFDEHVDTTRDSVIHWHQQGKQ
jgi:hypothetical protein